MSDLAALELLLMNYAAGSLGPFEALMMASHIALNPRARQKVSAYEELGGKLVHNETPAPVASGCLKSVLNRIDALEECLPVKKQADDRARLAQEFGIPPAIYNIMIQAADQNCWKWSALSDDIEVIDITLCPRKYQKKYNGHLRLMRAKPDVQTLQHKHEDGYEITLVLTGSYTDETGEYVTGDIVFLQPDPHFSHRPRAGKDGCLCLVLHDEGAQPMQTGLIDRFLNKFRRK